MTILESVTIKGNCFRPVSPCLIVAMVPSSLRVQMIKTWLMNLVIFLFKRSWTLSLRLLTPLTNQLTLYLLNPSRMSLFLNLIFYQKVRYVQLFCRPPRSPVHLIRFQPRYLLSILTNFYLQSQE